MLYNRAAPVSFQLRLARKDLGLALAAGYDVGAAMPLVAAALETFTMALGAHGDEDVALIAAFVDEMSQAPA
jgi:3-hydroxyisobutyrate dehydrogenase-like beta-hydroxyacid dehydrogenase